jgi:hypothetical protein
MHTYFRPVTAVVAAVAALFILTSVATAKIITQETVSLAGEITVNVTQNKKGQKKIALLNLKLLCPDTVRQFNASRLAGITSAKVSKKGNFTLKKSGVKVTHSITGQKLGTGSFVIRGKLEGKRLVGTYTVKTKGCMINKNIKLSPGLL